MPDLPDEPTEEASERDGFLSYAVEVHALGLGVGAGMTAALTGRWEIVGVTGSVALGVGGAAVSSAPVARNITREPWYFLGGLAVGLVAGAAIRVALGRPPVSL
jgi:hypothetical protein